MAKNGEEMSRRAQFVSSVFCSRLLAAGEALRRVSAGNRGTIISIIRFFTLKKILRLYKI